MPHRESMEGSHPLPGVSRQQNVKPVADTISCANAMTSFYFSLTCNGAAALFFPYRPSPPPPPPTLVVTAVLFFETFFHSIFMNTASIHGSRRLLTNVVVHQHAFLIFIRFLLAHCLHSDNINDCKMCKGSLLRLWNILDVQKTEQFMGKCHCQLIFTGRTQANFRKTLQKQSIC